MAIKHLRIGNKKSFRRNLRDLKNETFSMKNNQMASSRITLLLIRRPPMIQICRRILFNDYKVVIFLQIINPEKINQLILYIQSTNDPL